MEKEEQTEVGKMNIEEIWEKFKKVLNQVSRLSGLPMELEKLKGWLQEVETTSDALTTGCDELRILLGMEEVVWDGR